jgi:hypothetical protein
VGNVVKKSVSVPDIVWSAAEEAAANGHTTVSALVTEALENLLAVREGLAAVREWEREHGALTMEELVEAEAILDQAGIKRKGKP